MNKRLFAIIFTIITVSGSLLQAQFDKFGFTFQGSAEYNSYPVIAYNYAAQEWNETSQRQLNQCLVGRGLYCPYVFKQSSEDRSQVYSLSIKLKPDGWIYTLPNIFEEYYILLPDYTYDDLKTSGINITYRSKTLPEYNN